MVVMDVDLETHDTISIPHVEEASSGSEMDKTPKDRLIELLDQVEVHVEQLRKEAMKLEEDRDSLFTTLDTIRNSDLLATLNDNDREDVIRYTERLSARCVTVDVMVRTTRDRIQEEALFQVNRLIDNLVIALKDDPASTRLRCMSYMAACTSNFCQGSSDKTFEMAILGCTIDDQKRIRKRLQGLLDYMNPDTVITGIDN